MERAVKGVLLLLILSAGQAALGQAKPSPPISMLTSSPAYAEILLRKTELTAEAESLLSDFTEDYPKVKEIRIELEILRTETDRLLSVKPADSGKLTLALGKLILRKVSHTAELKRLQAQYQDAHPNVKKEKRMVEIFEAAIKEILG